MNFVCKSLKSMIDMFTVYIETAPSAIKTG